MKFTTATALFAISASVASAAPAFNTQVPISKAATTTTPSVEQPSIILDYFTVSSVAEKSSRTHTRDHDHHSHTKTNSAAPVAVSIQPIGQQGIFIPSGISIHRSVPTTIVSNGQTTVSSVEAISFLHFGPGPARFSPRTSATPSSTVAAHTSTPVVEQFAAGSTSSGLPFTLHFGFQAQSSKPSYSSVSPRSASSSAPHSAPSSSIPSYKTTVYSTIYLKPSTISVSVPKSTITSVISVSGKMYTTTETVHHKSSVASSPSAKSYVSSSSAKESVTYKPKDVTSSSSSSTVSRSYTSHSGSSMQHSTLATSVRSSSVRSSTTTPHATSSATSSSASSSSSTVSRPYTSYSGSSMQHSTLVTSVRSSSVRSSTTTPYAASSATSSSKAAGLPFTLHFGFPMQKSSSTTTHSSKPTPVAASYTTTSFIKVTPIPAYTSASSATPTTTTKKSFFGIF